jgi:PKD repeat protein
MTVDWGDGSTPESFTYPAGTTTFSETHTYLDDDPSGTPADDYTLSVTLSDDDTGSAGDSTVLTVHNVAPQVDAGADITVTLGTAVTFSGTYSDAGTLDTHTLEWDFGDGSIVTGTLTPTHTYAVGVYTATLTVTDDDGGAGSDIAVVTVERIKFYLPLVARD